MGPFAELPQPSLFAGPDGVPEARTGAEDLARGGYRRAYAFTGPPGTYAIQRVETHARYMCGDCPVVEYDGVYFEFFRFAEDGSLGRLANGRRQRDIHAFDLRRDGWDPGGLSELYRQHLRDGSGRPYRCRKPAQIHCTKQFVLGTGDVHDACVLTQTEDGGAFGFLLEGPSGPSQATLTLRAPGGEPACPLPLESPFPTRDAKAAGGGRFRDDQGWGGGGAVRLRVRDDRWELRRRRGLSANRPDL